jgi:hypothetical protein
MVDERDREREDEDERDMDVMDRDDAEAANEANSVACAVCGKDIPHGLGLECDECENVFCDGSCARKYGCDGDIHR